MDEKALVEMSGVTRKKTFLTSFKKDYLTNWQLYLFLVPAIVYIVIFAYIPMAGLQIAFKQYNFTLGIWGSDWVGLYNFEKFFNSYKFKTILWNTISVSFYSFLTFPLPIILALILNAYTGQRFKKFVQNITYVPHFISTVVLVGMIYQTFNPRTGLLGSLYQFITGKLIPDALANPDAFQHIYVWSGVWQGIGWGSIIYIAALSGVDEQLHEAAQVDGFTRLQRVMHIDFPSILPTVTIMLILSVGHIMDVGFEKVYLLQNSLNIDRSEVISTYVYFVAFKSGITDFSYATAIGFFNAIINFALLVVVNFISKRLTGSSLW
jgi:putative aldouronate transport system permease protein